MCHTYTAWYRDPKSGCGHWEVLDAHDKKDCSCYPRYSDSVDERSGKCERCKSKKQPLSEAEPESTFDPGDRGHSPPPANPVHSQSTDAWTMSLAYRPKNTGRGLNNQDPRGIQAGQKLQPNHRVNEARGMPGGDSKRRQPHVGPVQGAKPVVKVDNGNERPGNLHGQQPRQYGQQKQRAVNDNPQVTGAQQQEERPKAGTAPSSRDNSSGGEQRKRRRDGSSSSEEPKRPWKQKVLYVKGSLQW